MIEQTIKNLRSPDPTLRRDAIFALARTGDPRALPVLKKVMEIETDPALKSLAEKAHTHIQKQEWQRAEAAAQQPALQTTQLAVSTAPTAVIKPAAPVVEVPAPPKISERKKALAKGL